MQPGNRREEREDEIVQAGDEMIKSLRIVKKGGRVLCCNCGGKVQPGMAYVRIGRKNYCVMCEGPGKEAWEALE